MAKGETSRMETLARRPVKETNLGNELSRRNGKGQNDLRNDRF
jgi:hypothetical protein